MEACDSLTWYSNLRLVNLDLQDLQDLQDSTVKWKLHKTANLALAAIKLCIFKKENTNTVY